MKSLLIITILLGALPIVNQVKAAPQDNIRKETVLRTDTITFVDTVITTKKVRRTELIERYEEVIYSDFIINSAPVKTGSAAKTAPEEIVLQERIFADTEPLAAKPDSLSAKEGGKYIWIPDSLIAGINAFMRGDVPAELMTQAVRNTPMVKEEDELVTFRGDTIKMVLRDRNFGRYDRGLLNYLFIPKGVWTIGLTASYGEFSTKDLEVLDLLSDIDFSGHLFSIRPYFSYFVGNNRSVGMRLGYTSGKATIGSFKVDIDEDMNFNLHDISYRSENYTAAITYNQYFGMARRGRFGIFNEVELAFSSGNSDFIRPFAGELKTTHTNSMEVALNFSPGLCVYIMDPVAFNISFGVFGVTLRNYKQTVDGVDMGNRFTSAANFRFNIFNISFGIAVNL